MFFFFSEQEIPAVALGILAALLSAVAFYPYIRDTMMGRTQPQRASWFVWSSLGTIAFLSQIYEGASASLWFAGVQVGGTLTVFLLSLWTGTGRIFERSDLTVLVLAGFGLLLWYFTENAAYALAITIAISLLAGGVTMAKAYNDPDSETPSTWGLFFLSSICALVSVGSFEWILLAYPLYLFSLYGMIIVALTLGQTRRAVQAGLDDPSTFLEAEETASNLPEQGYTTLQTTG